MQSLKSFCIILLVVSLFGCANPFTQYNADSGLPKDRFIIPSDSPMIFGGSDPQEDGKKMFENGYALVGYSSFWKGGSLDWEDAKIQAKKVGAEIVFCYSKYKDTVSGVYPLITPDVRTSTTTSSGSIYGSGGYGTYSGSGTTTTYGTNTTFIPYNISRSDYLATYWGKTKPPVLGV